MAIIKVETVADRPIIPEILQDEYLRKLPCLEVRNARWQYSLLSVDRDRMICTFEAPDAESVRQAYRQAKADFGKKIWTARVIDSESVSPAGKEAILQVFEGSYPNGFTDADWNEILQCDREGSIELVGCYISLDKTRVLCELKASDATAIREVYSKAGIECDRIWSAEVLKP
ncbi:MAG: nickel-binding protein [Microcoleus sp.]